MSHDAPSRELAEPPLQPHRTRVEPALSCERESFTVTGSTTTVLFLGGEIDMLAHPSLHDALTGLRGHGTANSIVDLTGVRFCSVGGFSMLLDTARVIETEGRHFAVVARSRRLDRAGSLLWPDHRVRRHATIAGAMADIRHRAVVARGADPAPTRHVHATAPR